jgi:hypothetical protein
MPVNYYDEGKPGCGGCADQGCAPQCGEGCTAGCAEGCSGNCSSGCKSCCGKGGWLNKIWGAAPCADSCPQIGFYVWSGYESWRGPSEGTFPDNNGGSGGGNIAMPIGSWMKEKGIGFQMGGSYGLYNWNGSASNGNQQAQQQAFYTYGFFRRADEGRRTSWGIVQDWQVNTNFGELGQSFALSQWRGQIAYALSAKNEVGFTGSLRDQGAVKPTAGLGDVRYQAVNQINAFYHRKFMSCGGDGWFYIGVPENYRLNTTQGGSLGGVIFGNRMLVPLNDCTSLYANWNYMAPSSSNPSSTTTRDEVWNISIGMAWYPGKAARSRSVAGQKYMPYMNVADNGNFFVDSNTSF